eukprot:s2960_g12.t1
MGKYRNWLLVELFQEFMQKEDPFGKIEECLIEMEGLECEVLTMLGITEHGVDSVGVLLEGEGEGLAESELGVEPHPVEGPRRLSGPAGASYAASKQLVQVRRRDDFCKAISSAELAFSSMARTFSLSPGACICLIMYGKYEGFIPNPIGSNKLLGRAIQDMLAASRKRQRQLPQLDGRGSSKVNRLGTDRGYSIEQLHSEVEAKTPAALPDLAWPASKAGLWHQPQRVRLVGSLPKPHTQPAGQQHSTLCASSIKDIQNLFQGLVEGLTTYSFRRLMPTVGHARVFR